MNYNHISSFDKKIRIFSLTVSDMKNLAILDIEKENPIKFINTIVTKKCNLPGIKNDIIGKLIKDILDISNIDYNEETKKDLIRLNQLASTHPTLFNDNNERPDIKEEAFKIYKNLIEDIRINLNSFLHDNFRILTKINISTADLDSMPYWEYKKYLQFLK